MPPPDAPARAPHSECTPADRDPAPALPASTPDRPRELGGRAGPDPTRFGDWELAGRCIDF